MIKKTLTRVLTMMLAVFLAFSCVNVASGSNVAMAQSKSTQAKKAYAKKLAQVSKGKNVFNLVGEMKDVKFAIAKLNKDSIPELIVSADDEYHTRIYSYVNGKVKLIADGFAGELKYYPSKNLIYSDTYHAGKLVTYTKFNGKKSTVVACEDAEEKEPGIYASSKYKMKGKVVSKKKYTEYVKKLKGKAKPLKVKLVSNTAKNRSKKLGYKK